MDNEDILVQQYNNYVYFGECKILCQDYHIINRIDYIVWNHRTKTTLSTIPETDDRPPKTSETLKKLCEAALKAHTRVAG